MLEPAPTTRIAPTLARGTLAAVQPPTATEPASIVLTVPNTDYRLHLRPLGDDLSPFDTRVGATIIGKIRAEARRVDVVGAGGRYIEPCVGRPRRVQGMVVAVVPAENAVVVRSGVPIHLILTAPGQSHDRFKIDDFVSCDVMDGASFELVG